MKGKVEVLRQNDKGAWSAKIVDGSAETWYGLGFKKPSISQGDMIEFEASQNGRFWNIDQKSIQVVQNDVQQNKPVSDVVGSSGGAQSKDEFWSNKEKKEEFKQKQINWQAARNSAIALVPTLLEQGVVKLPTKKADQYDAVLGVVDELSVRFYNDTQDPEAKMGGGVESSEFGDLEEEIKFDD